MDEALVPPGFFPHTADAPAGGTTHTLPVPVITAEKVKQELREFTQKLLNTDSPTDAKKLNIEIQRRRVALILINESENKEHDGDYHKEMTLLNKMLAGEDEDPNKPDEDKAALTAEAEEILAGRGIDSKRAAVFMSVLEAMMSRVNMDGPRKPAADNASA